MPRILPDWISAYVEYTKETESPEKLHFWTAISTVAGALRRKVWFNQRHFNWYPNFFIIFVGPPGVVAKSTTISIGMSILSELPYISFGPAASTWQAFVKFLANCAIEAPMSDGSFMTMCPATVSVSELGTFLDPRNGEQINVLTDLWDGRDDVWKKITKEHGNDEIPNPWVNLIGCTTPSWIAENISEYFSEGGFASRTVFIYADKKKKLIAYPGREIPEDFYENKNILIHDLDHIAQLSGQFTMTEEAFAWGDEWYNKHTKAMQNGSYEHLPGDKYKFYLARKQTHLHKLAMVLSASQRDDLKITEEDLKRSAKYLYETEKDLPKVFGQTYREADAMLVRDAVDIIKREGTILRSKLFSEHFMNRVSWPTFERIMQSLIGAEFVVQIKDSEGLKVKMKGQKTNEVHS